MKRLQVAILAVTLLALPQIGSAQTMRANRAWKPFFTSFRAAVKKRDQAAIMKFMSRDFYYLSSGGDENGNKDTRDEALEYWESTEIGALDALEKALAQGAVINTAMRQPENRNPSRVSPPLANDKQAIKDRSFPWYAVFEFRNGRWYWTAFTECCE